MKTTSKRVTSANDPRTHRDRMDFKKEDYICCARTVIETLGWTLTYEGLEVQFNLGDGPYPSLLFDPRHGEKLGKENGRLRLRLRILDDKHVKFDPKTIETVLKTQLSEHEVAVHRRLSDEKHPRKVIDVVVFSKVRRPLPEDEGVSETRRRFKNFVAAVLPLLIRAAQL
jgi:hypothetical protein